MHTHVYVRHRLRYRFWGHVDMGSTCVGLGGLWFMGVGDGDGDGDCDRG